MSGTSETPLEQAERHEKEGRARILRQSALIARLEGDGHVKLAQDARRILEIMESAQRTFEQQMFQEHAKLQRESVCV